MSGTPAPVSAWAPAWSAPAPPAEPSRRSIALTSVTIPVDSIKASQIAASKTPEAGHVDFLLIIGCGAQQHATEIVSTDPTLALGFYCRDGDDLDSLFASVKALAEANATAPVLDVRSATEAKAFDARASSPSTARGRALKDDEFHDWEFL